MEMRNNGNVAAPLERDEASDNVFLISGLCEWRCVATASVTCCSLEDAKWRNDETPHYGILDAGVNV
jgi:hypothetical protein